MLHQAPPGTRAAILPLEPLTRLDPRRRHPGFNKTEMTAKYAEIWEREGAVPTEEGALRVLHETGGATMAKTGTFINCEDGLQIPW